MIRIAILDDLLPAQLQENDDPNLDDVEVVWTGTQLDGLLTRALVQRPQVVVLNVDLAGPDDPGEVVRQVKERTGAELLIALYSFLPRRQLDAVAAHGRPLRSPISLARLRSQMLGVVVRNFFTKGNAGSEAPSGASKNGSPTDRTAPLASPKPGPTVPSPRFSRAQLARLMEIQSAVDCECPNHLGEIVAGLQAFEVYARRCENRNAKDAEVHQMLAKETLRARQIMEEALAQLIVHEGFVI